MKRRGNLFDSICSLENLFLADQRARKGKEHQPGVKKHKKSWQVNLYRLHHALHTGTYRTSAYTTFPVYEPKERLVFKLPYFPDRIVHHAVMNIMEALFRSWFTADTHSCIKGRGIMGAYRQVRKALRDRTNTQYCLKIDVRKFYPSIDHAILKQLLRRKLKDRRLLWLLDEIIDSADGLPIGNYLSQYFANFFLTGFDHWIKQTKKVRSYTRYLDDCVFFAADKPSLHQLLADIREYLRAELKLELKANYQIFPVEARGVDFGGFVHRHDYVLLRPGIKKNLCRMLKRRPNLLSIASYNGWLKYCNSNNLAKTLSINETIFRLQNQTRRQKLRRRQNRDRRHPEQADHSP